MVSFRRGALALLVLALVLPDAGAVPRAPQEPTSLDDWARLLLEHPGLRAGDRDGAVGAWLDALEAEPDHPLVPATAVLLATVEDELADPLAFRARVARLRPERFPPAARGPIMRLVGNAASSGTESWIDGHDRHPDVLRAHFVLGPLPSAEDPLSLGIDAGRLADPGLDHAHAGLRGELVFASLTRGPLSSRVDPDDAVEASAGWLLLAAPFEVQGGGPAWIEVDLSGPRDRRDDGQGSAFSFDDEFRGWVLGGTPLRTPGYALGLAGGEQQLVRLDSGDRGARALHPCVLRDGRNVLLLRFPAGAGFTPRLRVLDAAGLPLPSCRPGPRVGVLGRPVEAPLPTDPPADALTPLLAVDAPTPHVQALTGLLLALDRRPDEGLRRLEQAALRDGGPDLSALLAGVLERTAYLPESWRRARARSLVQRVLELDPDHLPMGVARALTLIAEDQQEQAIEELEALGETHPEQPWSLLALSRAYGSLGLSVPAAEALQRAAALAPRSPLVLRRRIGLARDQERQGDAVALQVELVEALGRGPGQVEALARAVMASGRLSEGLQLWSEALGRDPSRGRRARWAESLMSIERFDDARRELSALAGEHPDWATPWFGLADVAVRTGDAAAEQQALSRGLLLRPGHRAARERLAALTGEDPEAEFVARFALDGEQLASGYDGAGRDESVVRLLDEALVRLFADGSMETRTHEIVQLRDLAACDRRGTLRLRGDVLRVETVKPDGRRLHPVRVNGEYVMPNLEPGDLLDTITRTFDAPPSDGVLRPGAWFFASLDEPFLVSRYVVRLPPGLGLRLEQRRFEGTHEQVTWGDEVVHVFEQRDAARVLPERGMPPADWFLPWVGFGMDADPAAALHGAQLTWPPAARPTHELREAAAEVVADLEGQSAAARALYAFVDRQLQQRSGYPVDAVSSLLARQGNPTLLFAALLTCRGIDHELVLSRGVTPAADPEPDPPFVQGDRLHRRLLVRVMPDDGEPVWCDPAIRGLPFGALSGEAPGAEALSVRDGRRLHEPAQQPPGRALDLTCRLGDDGAAAVAGTLTLLGASGQAAKEQLRQVPEVYHRSVVQSMAAAVLPGIDLAEHAIEGLAEGDPGQLVLRFAGRVPRFLDPDLSRVLPIVPLGVSAGLAVEGRRRLPFLSADLGVERTRVRVELPADLGVAELPAGFEGTVRGWSYRLAVAATGPREVTVERELVQEPFHLEADEFVELVQFAAALDAAERARLRLLRVGGGAGAGGR